jgi:hypothetical protein
MGRFGVIERVTNDKACLALAIIENRDLAMSIRSQLKRIITNNPSES